jgi:hypothetical protein
MSFLDKIGGFLGGGLGTKIAEIVGNRIEDKGKAQLAQLELEKAIGDRAHELEMAQLQADKETELAFNERTKAMEGTASDLKSVPYVGALVLFLRGAFRPLFAYFTAYLDWLYFTETTPWTDKQQALVYAVNMLVLGFFFGERALKNVLPMVSKIFEARVG